MSDKCSSGGVIWPCMVLSSNITGRQLQLSSWTFNNRWQLALESCIKFVKWQHRAVRRGARFDVTRRSGLCCFSQFSCDGRCGHPVCNSLVDWLFYLRSATTTSVLTYSWSAAVAVLRRPSVLHAGTTHHCPDIQNWPERASTAAEPQSVCFSLLLSLRSFCALYY